MAFWVMEQISQSMMEAPDYKPPKLRLFAGFSGSGVSNGNHQNGKRMVERWFQGQHVPNSRLGDGSVQQRAESSVQASHTVMLDRLFHAVTCRTTGSTFHTAVCLLKRIRIRSRLV